MPTDIQNDEPNHLIEADDQAENIEDLAEIDRRVVSQAVVTGTDWTAETIINQIKKENIQLNPKFQRRDAWDVLRKSKFIESLVIGLPIPQIVIAESPSKKGTYIVIDGKQRLLAIRQFAAKADDKDYIPLVLKGLSIRKDLNNHSLESLKEDIYHSEDVSSFENQPIRTVVIKNWGSEDFLYQIFLRLNTGSVPLSPQELRQALHPGPFVSFIDEVSGLNPALQKILRLKKPDFRMRDAELLTRWYAFKFFAMNYSGNLKKFLDDSCLQLNLKFSDDILQAHEALVDFEDSVSTVFSIFGENAFRKWTSNGYERLFNRAIFDIMTYYFSDDVLRSLAKQNPQTIEDGFKYLCSNDAEFVSSIEKTTKSIGATTVRFQRWAQILSNICQIPVKSPFEL